MPGLPVPAGVTAAFNLNLLERINRELDGDFDLAKFRHRAFYNREKQRVEMHLVSLARHKVRVAGKCIDFRRGVSGNCGSLYILSYFNYIITREP